MQSLLIRTHGIVLKSIPFRESDVLATILTSDQGKISALARGAKRSKRRFPGGLQTFDCGSFEFAPPRGQSSLLTALALTKEYRWPLLQENLSRFLFASLCLELADALTPEGDPDSSQLLPLLDCALLDLNQISDEGLLFTNTAYYLLRVLCTFGTSPLDHPSFFSDSEQVTLQTLLNENRNSVPLAQRIPPRTLVRLMTFAEEILGRRLATRDGILQILTRTQPVEEEPFVL